MPSFSSIFFSGKKRKTRRKHRTFFFLFFSFNRTEKRENFKRQDFVFAHASDLGLCVCPFPDCSKSIVCQPEVDWNLRRFWKKQKKKTRPLKFRLNKYSSIIDLFFHWHIDLTLILLMINFSQIKMVSSLCSSNQNLLIAFARRNQMIRQCRW